MAGSATDSSSARRFQPPVRIQRTNGQFVLHTGDGDFRWRLPRLYVWTPANERLVVNGTRYHGTSVLVPLDHRGRETGRLDVVNHVPMETYLAGVLEGELWPNWNSETFKAQAIAARSYALFERHLHRQKHFDLASTTASQVYGGESTNAKVLSAVRSTRGRS